MDRQNVFEWLWIINCFGCGSVRIWEFIENFGSASEAYEALRKPQDVRNMLTAKELKSAEGVSENQINELISYCERGNIYILTIDDEKYPERLRSIYNPPAALFCRGDMTCLENDFCLSVVGTRKPSEYSVRLTSALVKELCRLGIGIISGFAVGIDITANMSAVKSGGKTVAVLGCGLDRDYPKENFKYRAEIEKNGLFISEYYPKTAGTSISFPARNRILSGLSLGTVVVEAAEKSGALITANLALSQGRDIFVFAPHDLFDRRYGGNVALIRDGAICLCGVKDILYEYYENYGHKIASAADEMLVNLPPDIPENAGTNKKSAADNAAETVKSVKRTEKAEPKPAEEYDPSGLTEDEAAVYGVLKRAGKAVPIDEIAEECGMDISDLLMLLTDMEIDGAVTSAAGQSYIAN